MIRVRIKGTDKFVGKRIPRYAFNCDQSGRPPFEGMFMEERYAKVWTDVKFLRALLTSVVKVTFTPDDQRLELNWKTAGWSHYEVVHPDGSSEPLDDYLARV